MDTISPTSSTGSVELGDYMVCNHGKEMCSQCGVDHREDNCFTAGVDPVGERESIEVDFTYNKDGVPQCKKHKNTLCNSCFGFKKQIIKLNKDSAKAAKAKSREPKSNLMI